MSRRNSTINDVRKNLKNVGMLNPMRDESEVKYRRREWEAPVITAVPKVVDSGTSHELSWRVRVMI